MVTTRSLLVLSGVAAAVLWVGCATEPPPSPPPPEPLINKILYDATAPPTSHIASINYDGSDAAVLTEPGEFVTFPAVSPDGMMVAIVLGGDIWILHVDGSRWNLTNSLATFDFLPAWAPDGTRIAYASSVNQNFDIHIISLDQRENRRLTFDPARDLRPTWHPSGTRLAFASERDGNAEVYSINADGTGLVNLTNNPGDDDAPAWSHDGTRIVFESNRSIGVQLEEIFLMDADGSNQRQLLSIEGAVQPAWSPGDSLIAFAMRGPNGMFEIFLTDSLGRPPVQVTDDLFENFAPTFSP